MRKDIPNEMFYSLLSELKTGEYIIRRAIGGAGREERDNYCAVSLRDGVELVSLYREFRWRQPGNILETKPMAECGEIHEEYQFECSVLGRELFSDYYRLTVPFDAFKKNDGLRLGRNFANLYKYLKKHADKDFDYKLTQSLLTVRQLQLNSVRRSISDNFIPQK